MVQLTTSSSSSSIRYKCMRVAHTWHTAFCFLLRCFVHFSFSVWPLSCGLFRLVKRPFLCGNAYFENGYLPNVVADIISLLRFGSQIIELLFAFAKLIYSIDRFDQKQERLWRLSNICVCFEKHANYETVCWLAGTTFFCVRKQHRPRWHATLRHEPA